MAPDCSLAQLVQLLLEPMVNTQSTTMVPTESPYMFAIDDLNNDGRLDIYGISGSSVIWVLGQPSGWSGTQSISLAGTPADVPLFMPQCRQPFRLASFSRQAFTSGRVP